MLRVSVGVGTWSVFGRTIDTVGIVFDFRSMTESVIGRPTSVVNGFGVFDEDAAVRGWAGVIVMSFRTFSSYPTIAERGKGVGN